MSEPTSAPKTSPVVGIITAIVLLAAAGFILAKFGIGRSGESSVRPVGQNYYTIDDGQTYFADSVTKIPPFERDGKQAVQACVFKDPESGKAFVAFLLRNPPETKNYLENQQRNPGPSTGPSDISLEVEVKPPLTGDDKWMKSTDPAAANLLSPKSASGVPAEPVTPPT